MNKYYRYLEKLMQEKFKGDMTPMFGAAPILAEEFDLEEKEAKDILLFWMEHHDQIMGELND